MATTDEDLDATRKRVEKLRHDVAAERQKRQEREAGLVHDVEAAQLAAEEARLTAQLEEEKAANKVAEVKAGASYVLDAAKAEQALAEAQAKAQADLREQTVKDRADAKEAGPAEPQASVAEVPVTSAHADNLKG